MRASRGPHDVEIRELSAAPDDLARLSQFFERLYVPEFPDPDERESLANIEQCLRRKAKGWYGRNDYHVLLLFERGELRGGSIADYLAEVDTGVIEFLVVDPKRRRAGLGRALLERTEQLLAADARRDGRELAAVVAELNDPFKSPREDSLDPFARLRIWGRGGYAKSDFPYVQPALSPEQRPVSHLMLAVKPFGVRAGALPADTVLRIVHEYIRWAMRSEDPSSRPEYRAMGEHLARHREVAMVSLAVYIGEDAGRPLLVHEITTTEEPDLDAVVMVYARAFPAGPTAVDPAVFRHSVENAGRRSGGYAHHLWALRPFPDAPVAGMTSFFTLPGAGFGGYLAFDEPLRHRGRLRAALAKIEAQMIADDHGARGWYIECAREAGVLPILCRLGFREADVDYRQPRLRETDPDGEVPLALLYKDFGAVHREPVVGVGGLLDSIASILRVVYGVERPTEHRVYRSVAASLAAREVVPFRVVG